MLHSKKKKKKKKKKHTHIGIRYDQREYNHIREDKHPSYSMCELVKVVAIRSPYAVKKIKRSKSCYQTIEITAVFSFLFELD